MDQRTSEWEKWRKQGLGGSDIAAVCYLRDDLKKYASPWMSPKDLFEIKKGIKDGFKGNFATERGNRLEPAARATFELLVGGMSIEDFPPALVEHPKHPFLRCSLDGFNTKLRRPLEIKCPGQHDHMLAVSGKVPDKYIPQVQMQLAVTGADLLYYFSYHPKLTPQGVIVEVKPDGELIEKLISAAVDFWQGYVLKDTPPPSPEEVKVTKVKDSDSTELVKRWILAKDALESAQENEADLRKRIIDRFAAHRCVECAGVVCVKSTRKGNVDYSKIPQLENVDLEPYRKPDTEFFTVKLKSEKES